MGGFRRGAGTLRNSTVEASFRLRVSAIAKGGLLVPGARLNGTVQSRDGYTGRVSGAVALDIDIAEDVGTVRLRLARPDAAGIMQAVGDQVVTIVASRQPRGGLRWRFVCPRTGDRCETLFSPSGASAFAGRTAWRLSYLSQRRSVRDRPLERARGIRLALGGTANMMDPFPDKPVGMWWRTYDRIRARARQAEKASLGIYAARLDAWMPGWQNRRVGA